MSTAGLITMLCTWTVVLFMVSRLFIRVLRTPADPNED
jgi:uncharacterized protein HemY